MLDAVPLDDCYTIRAVQHLCSMRGECQSHLLRCSDGALYVVKFINNPQHVRVLANEMFGTALARQLGLPVPDTAIVEVEDELIRNTPELAVWQDNRKTPFAPGLHFGSRYVIDPLDGRVFDYLPSAHLAGVRNIRAFAGALAFDKWTGNIDARQATFWRTLQQKRYTASFVDQASCFNGGKWTFPDQPMQGTYPSLVVYANVQGWESFDPWLGLIENMSESNILRATRNIPAAWCGSEGHQDKLVSALVVRREIVRDLIGTFRQSWCRPFPQWHK